MTSEERIAAFKKHVDEDLPTWLEEQERARKESIAFCDTQEFKDIQEKIEEDAKDQPIQGDEWDYDVPHPRVTEQEYYKFFNSAWDKASSEGLLIDDEGQTFPTDYCYVGNLKLEQMYGQGTLTMVSWYDSDHGPLELSKISVGILTGDQHRIISQRLKKIADFENILQVYKEESEEDPRYWVIVEEADGSHYYSSVEDSLEDLGFAISTVFKYL